jgi:hypothetical protein
MKAITCLCIGFLSCLSSAFPQVITGELKKWHRVTLTFDGPIVSETDSFNPFLNFRLNVQFTHGSGKTYTVPGFFAADGMAEETGATSGNKWRAYFSPDEEGVWTYNVSFRQGVNIAVSDSATEGIAIDALDSLRGSFVIDKTDKTGRDLRGSGRLDYVGASLMRFAETGEYFRKAGTDAPENFLAYVDFDSTPNYNNYRKTWAPHVQDWRTGDPVWQKTKGKGIIGAVNYLSSQGINSFSFLTMNINGDDKNVYPYINSASFTRMDVSKLAQWEIVFEHAQKMGMHLHFKMQETENNKLLDGGNLGIQRKLYIRELIARFSHHLALNWNLGEENTQTRQQQKDMARYVFDHDPYHHNIVLHTLPGSQEKIYRPLLGSASGLTGVSIQTDTSHVYAETRKWVETSANAGKKWIVANDEQNPASVGVAADAEYTGNRGTVADNSEAIRRTVLWGNFMAGGAGVEYYYGYGTGETDLTLQDFRSRAKSFRYAKNAVDFFAGNLSKTELKPMSNISKGWIIGNEDSSIFVAYLKTGGTASITIPAGTYSIKWYNPRAGGALQTGSVSSITGSGSKSIGYPPSYATLDWVILVRQASKAQMLSYQAENNTAQSGTTILTAHAGYTGTGYADYGGNGTWIEWNHVKKCGTLKFYYANGSSGKRQCAIIINGINVGNLSFASTGGWTIWKTTSINVSLTDSISTVRVLANTSAGGPNLDKMELLNVAGRPNIATNPTITSLNIYPNPVHEDLNIMSKNGGIINIYNLNGMKVYSNKNGKSLERINTNKLNEGVYLLELIDDNKRIIKQFIKIK